MRNPASVLMTSGGPARTVSATSAGSNPGPMIGKRRKRTARLGTTRTAATAPTNIGPSRRLRDTRMPSGTKMKRARRREVRLNRR